MAIPSWLQFTGLAKETDWGTAVAATTFYRGKPKLTVSDKSPTKEQGFSGIAAETMGYYPGVHATDVDTGELLFYPDDTPHLLMAMLGVDTVTGSAAPYTHTLTLLNSALPPSYSVSRFSGAVSTADQVAGVRFSEVDLKFANAGVFNIEAKGTGLTVAQTSKPSPNSYSAALPLIPWEAAITFGGSSYLRLTNVQITLKRAIDMIYGMHGSQDASDQNVGPLGVTGSLDIVPSDLTEFNYYLNGDQEALSILFTSSTNMLTLQISQIALLDGTELDDTGAYLKGTLKFEAIANSTDAGTGNAPMQVVAVNARETTY